MNTKEMTREQISALADGELADAHLDIALAALHQPAGLADWEIYHQIGDVLRSDDMAVTLSPDFAAHTAARLAMEPAIFAPAAALVSASALPETGQGVVSGAGALAMRSMRRWAIPGMVATAVATVAFVTAPQLMVAIKGDGDVSGGAVSTMVASAPAQVIPVNGQVMPVSMATSTAGEQQGAVVAASVPEGVVLRDPRIDDYLLAHQRFSPSVFSSAQYARSATFAADSNK